MSEPATILVLRADGEFSRELRREGFEVVNLELIVTKRADDLRQFEKLLDAVDEFDAIFVTSAVAAEILAEQLAKRDVTIAPTVYILGERSKKVLDGLSLRLEYRKAANTSEDLVRELGLATFEGKRVLFISGDRSMRVIPEMLSEVADVEEAIVYETRDTTLGPESEVILDRLRSREIDWLCFFSPSAVESYMKRNFPIDADWPSVAAIGETTAAAARSAGFSVKYVPDHATSRDFAEGLVRHIKSFE